MENNFIRSLKAQVEDEKGAGAEYTELAQQAREAGYPGIASDLEKIAGDEARHEQILKGGLEKMGEGKSCSCNSVQAVLRKSKYRIGEMDIVYKDPRFEVYSYEYGDGIWGTSVNLLENDNFKELTEKYGADAIRKAEEGQDVQVCVPISEITNKYSLLDRKGNLIMPSDRDLSHMCVAGSITLPDGKTVEPDAEDSPLRKMGLI